MFVHILPSNLVQSQDEWNPKLAHDLHNQLGCSYDVSAKEARERFQLIHCVVISKGCITMCGYNSVYSPLQRTPLFS